MTSAVDTKISRKGTYLPLCAIAFKHIIIFIQGSDSLVYTSLSGTVGMLVPFTSNEDHDFFQHLEMHMRGENPPMCGRDHLSYRLVNNNMVAAGMGGTWIVNYYSAQCFIITLSYSFVGSNTLIEL